MSRIYSTLSQTFTPFPFLSIQSTTINEKQQQLTISAASVFTPRVICPPDKRTFNSDGSRISEVGVREWEEGGKKEGEDGKGVGDKR